jgi:hypothetical protein
MRRLYRDGFEEKNAILTDTLGQADTSKRDSFRRHQLGKLSLAVNEPHTPHPLRDKLDRT